MNEDGKEKLYIALQYLLFTFCDPGELNCAEARYFQHTLLFDDETNIKRI